jgi:hypothetical protein
LRLFEDLGWTLDAMGKRSEAAKHFQLYSSNINILSNNIPIGRISNEIQKWGECFLFHWAFLSLTQG